MSCAEADAPCADREGCASISVVPERSAEAVDLELLHRIAARDDSALAALYDRHSRLAYSLIMRIVRSAADAEEILQETFVRVWTRADTYDPRLGVPAAWLTRIARNRAIDRIRARRVREAISVTPATRDDGSVAVPEPETLITPEHELLETMTSRAVGSALAHLPATQRQLIEAAFFEGYTHHELAALFGVPLGTVKTRIRTGLAALRGRLEQFA
jgi:RNA polymerase sigma-70 factor, ECF subfamily